MTSGSNNMNLLQSNFPEWYKKIEKLGDPLTGISDRIDFERIRPILSDLQIDLSIPGIICYGDKVYFGSECKGINGTMYRSVRGHPFAFMKVMFSFFLVHGDNCSKGRDILYCHVL